MPQSNVQIIKVNGVPDSVILPYQDYLKLLEAQEDADDVKLIRAADEKNADKKRISQADIDTMLGIN